MELELFHSNNKSVTEVRRVQYHSRLLLYTLTELQMFIIRPRGLVVWLTSVVWTLDTVQRFFTSLTLKHALGCVGQSCPASFILIILLVNHLILLTLGVYCETQSLGLWGALMVQPFLVFTGFGLWVFAGLLGASGFLAASKGATEGILGGGKVDVVTGGVVCDVIPRSKTGLFSLVKLCHIAHDDVNMH